MAYDNAAKDDSEDTRFKDWMQELKKFQESDLDQREQGREADRFLLDKDGQWEDSIARELDSQHRPRYTFDKVTPVIETMMADIEDMDFGCNIKPEGGQANKDIALMYEGMIRSIQNASRTDETYRNTARRLMRRGFDAWIVKAKYADEWSFDQDLRIETIINSINRVWTSNTCHKQDSSDSEVAYVLSSFSPEAYKKKWPEGKAISVDDSDIGDNWDEYSPEVVTIAERYYRKERKIEVVQLSNGKVLEVDEEFESIEDDLRKQGIVVNRRKTVDDFTWYHCAFDGGGILEKERETVFKTCPVVTLYGNYEHLGQNSKITWSGIVLKEMDSQRAHNYVKSREIEEIALAPREKLLMTKKQAKGHENQISRMNISADPVQFFNPDPDLPGYPQKTQGAQVNPALTNLANSTAMDINAQANVTDAMRGEFNGRQSEESVRKQVDRGTAATRKWINPLINGIRRVNEVVLQAIPSVYDTQRQFAIIGEDGTEDIILLNEEVYDQEASKMVRVLDLNQGKYKVVCEAGAAFANRMEAGLAALLEYAALDPSVIAQGGDIMLRAIDAPMVDKIAERKRAQMVQAGMIPEDQLTDEEKEQMAAQAQQPQEESPDMVFAKAEQQKADNQTQELQLKSRAQDIEIAKLEQSGQIASGKLSLQEAETVAGIRNKNANTMKTIAETESTNQQTMDQRLSGLTSLSPSLQ